MMIKVHLKRVSQRKKVIFAALKRPRDSYAPPEQ